MPRPTKTSSSDEPRYVFPEFETIREICNMTTVDDRVQEEQKRIEEGSMRLVKIFGVMKATFPAPDVPSVTTQKMIDYTTVEKVPGATETPSILTQGEYPWVRSTFTHGVPDRPYTGIGVCDYSKYTDAQQQVEGWTSWEQQQRTKFDVESSIPVTVGHWTVTDFEQIGRRLDASQKGLEHYIVLWPPKATEGKTRKERDQLRGSQYTGLLVKPTEPPSVVFVRMSDKGTFSTISQPLLRQMFMHVMADTDDGARFRHEIVRTHNSMCIDVSAPYEKDGITMIFRLPFVPDFMVSSVLKKFENDTRKHGLDMLGMPIEGKKPTNARRRRRAASSSSSSAAATNTNEIDSDHQEQEQQDDDMGKLNDVTNAMATTPTVVAAQTADEYAQATGKQLNHIVAGAEKVPESKSSSSSSSSSSSATVAKGANDAENTSKAAAASAVDANKDEVEVKKTPARKRAAPTAAKGDKAPARKRDRSKKKAEPAVAEEMDVDTTSNDGLTREAVLAAARRYMNDDGSSKETRFTAKMFEEKMKQFEPVKTLCRAIKDAPDDDKRSKIETVLLWGFLTVTEKFFPELTEGDNCDVVDDDVKVLFNEPTSRRSLEFLLHAYATNNTNISYFTKEKYEAWEREQGNHFLATLDCARKERFDDNERERQAIKERLAFTGFFHLFTTFFADMLVDKAAEAKKKEDEDLELFDIF